MLKKCCFVLGFEALGLGLKGLRDQGFEIRKVFGIWWSRFMDYGLWNTV